LTFGVAGDLPCWFKSDSGFPVHVPHFKRLYHTDASRKCPIEICKAAVETLAVFSLFSALYRSEGYLRRGFARGIEDRRALGEGLEAQRLLRIVLDDNTAVPLVLGANFAVDMRPEWEGDWC
jgi:hypothetical protein